VTSGGEAHTPTSRQRLPFAALLAATSISLVGNELTAIAIPWLVLTSLGTPLDAGIVGAGIVIPSVIGALAGGVIVDRLGSRRMSILADITSATAVAAIPLFALTIGLSIPVVLVLAFAGALFDAPGATARQVLLPDVAARAGIGPDRANAIFQTTQNISFMVGPIVAGLIIALVGPSNALWFDAASFVVSASIVAVAIPAAARGPAAEELADVLAGLRLLARDAVIRAMTLVAAIANFVGTPMFGVLLPAFALHAGAGADELGLLVASFAAGSVVGAVGYGILGSRASRQRTMAIGFVGAGIGVAALSLEPPIPIAIGALFLAGLASGPVNPIALTVLQERIPPAIRGRAIGAVFAAVLVAAPVGMLALGALTNARGPVVGLGVAGIVYIVVGALVALWPTFRELGAVPLEPTGEA
jgi:MFS family permease